MGYSTDRIILFDRYENPLGDLPPAMLAARPREVEEVNGEHTLSITTRAPCPLLAKGTRVLNQDGTGKWHEWVVDEPHEEHGVGEYLCVWSLQHDLEATDTNERWASAEQGAHTPVSASTALSVALADNGKWGVGSVTVATTGACSLYDQQVWDNVKKVVDVFGGELDAEITVGVTGVTSRRVALLAHVGKTKATRRFDYGRDLVGVTRSEEPGPRWCGIRPRGGQAKKDADGVDYSMRVGVEAYLGTPYIYDDEVDEETGVSVKELNRISDGQGGWIYPCKTVIYDQDVEGVDDQYALAQELYEMAAPDLHTYTRPSVSYTADVLQLARGGFDPKGVACGDEVHIVDRTFADGAGLRVPGRVLRIERDLPIGGAESNGPAELTLGQIGFTLADRMRDIASTLADRMADRMGDVNARVDEILSGGTLVYLEGILDSINAQLNTEGGWEYKVAGHGTYVYDREVTDPAVGAEATRAIHLGGGFMRFANSKTSSGDWRWTNVITANGYLGLAATIAAITSGSIRDANENVVIDLDGGTVTFKQGLIQTADGRSYWNLGNGALRSYGVSAGAEFGKYRQTGYYRHYEKTSYSTLPASDSTYVYYMLNGVVYRALRTDEKLLQLASKMTFSDGGIVLEKYKDTTADVTRTIGADDDLYVTLSADDTLESRMVIDEGWSYETDLGKIVDISVTRDVNHGYAAEGTSTWYYDHDFPTLRLRARHGNSSSSAYYDSGLTVTVGDPTTDSGVIYPETRAVADGPMYIRGGGLYANGSLKYSHYVSIGEISGSNSVVVVRDLMQTSDRRLKEHVSWLGEDAVRFVRELRPALFDMGGLRRLGFYAQDVAEGDEWGSDTVRQGVDEDGSLGYDPLLLDYQALIAPLTAYAQALERRVDEQRGQIEALTKRLEALEKRRQGQETNGE